jgi:hypothetical protein
MNFSEILQIGVIVLGSFLAILGGVGGLAFTIHAMKHVKREAKNSENFNHEEDMGACIEYIMYMVTAIFFYLGSAIGIIMLLGVDVK